MDFNSWIDKQMVYLSSHLGVYRINAGNNFHFEPTPGFYGLICQGTISALNEAITILANHIGSTSVPIIEAWEGSQNPLTANNFNWKNGGPPGLIKYTGRGHSRIQIAITNKHSPLIMGAILAHELTHHFLFEKSIIIKDTVENEKMTDFATAYLGLGKITLNGYEPISWTMQKEGKECYFSYQIGYLSPESMAQILHKVSLFRGLSNDNAEEWLSPPSLVYFRNALKKYAYYLEKKEFVGEKKCTVCNETTCFEFDEDGSLRCPKCGWAWEALQKRHQKNLAEPKVSQNKTLSEILINFFLK
jgi:ssDNA-binding Zn-finger/Zn-ribbon topoisomerase 1